MTIETVKTTKKSIPKYVIYVLIAAAGILALTVLILGLVFGLRSLYSKDCTLSDREKLDSCAELTCRNRTLLSELISYTCVTPSTARSTITTTTPRTTTTTTTITTTTTKPAIARINYRLPNDLKPSHYDIVVKIQFVNESEARFPYDGEVTIQFSCVKNTSSLILHINNLILNNSTLSLKSTTDQSYGEYKAFNWRNDFQRHFFIANLTKPFIAGHNYTFHVKFTGFLEDDDAGFYRSSYIDANGVKKWLMTSQLESTEARKSFPCFDEPAFKATWKITAIHQKGYIALSNMPVDRVTNFDTEHVKTEFLPTPKMSSYLVALVVSDFKCIDSTANAGLLPSGKLPVGSCGRPTAADQLEFGLNTAVNSIEHFERLFELKYPLPKIDHIAIPDFRSGAMENWGLVTYRQARYLYAVNATPASIETSIVTVVAHETAHMWFGNIVTLEWWNDLWLNEALASFFEYTGSATKYQMQTLFKNVFFNTLHTDAVATGRPISLDVGSPDEIQSVFDATTYSKGASIIEMVKNFLGYETFIKGINRYLARYSFGNTNGQMFWDALDEAAKEDKKLSGVRLNEIMNTWMKQMGYPVVTMRRVDNRTITLTQNHFLLDPKKVPIVQSDYNYRWYIPFTHTIEKIGSINSNNTSANNLWQNVIWFNETTKTIQLAKQLADDEFILANVRASGFYRINYDDHFWSRIIKQLKTNKDAIPVESRAQLIQDTFAFSEARLIDGERVLDIAEHLASETMELPWLAFINRANLLSNMLLTTSVYGDYQNYLRSLISVFYKKVGLEETASDTWIEKQIRPNIVSSACLTGVPECVDKAKAYYAAWMSKENNNTIPAAYRSALYCTAVREGGEKEWNFAARQYSKETAAAERGNLIEAMSCTRLTWLISRYLSNQLEYTRAGDALVALRVTIAKPDGVLKAWNFVKENWNVLYQRYGANTAALIVDFSSIFNTQSLLDDFSTFFEKNANVTVLGAQLKASRDKIVNNVEWHKKSFNGIKTWFANKYGSSESKQVTQESVKNVMDDIITEPVQQDIFDQPMITRSL